MKPHTPHPNKSLILYPKRFLISAFRTARAAGKMWDLQSQQVVQFAQHDAPIKSVHMVDQHNMVVTASWDKTLRCVAAAAAAAAAAAGAAAAAAAPLLHREP